MEGSKKGRLLHGIKDKRFSVTPKLQEAIPLLWYDMPLKTYQPTGKGTIMNCIDIKILSGSSVKCKVQIAKKYVPLLCEYKTVADLPDDIWLCWRGTEK